MPRKQAFRGPNVCIDLIDQRFFAVKFALAANAIVNIEGQNTSVKIARKIEQMDFTLCLVPAKCRAFAVIDNGDMGPDPTLQHLRKPPAAAGACPGFQT